MATATEFLQYLFGRLKADKPVTHMVDQQPYAVKENGTLGEPVRPLAPQFVKPMLPVLSLDGLVAAYRAGIDSFSGKVGLHIIDPFWVQLLSLEADDFGRRHVWVSAQFAQECPFFFGKYYDSEAFLLAFRTSFLYEENAVLIQRLISNLSADNSISVSDDGLSQQITIREGGVTRTQIALPPEIPLIPWRTFREVTPVSSKFMLRLKGVKDCVPQVALFEVDARWRLDNIQAVADYLAGQLPDVVIIK